MRLSVNDSLVQNAAQATLAADLPPPAYPKQRFGLGRHQAVDVLPGH